MKKDLDLQQGDCLELFKQIPNESVDLIVTDCPYRVVSGGRTSDIAKGGIFDQYDAGFQNGKIFLDNDICFDQWLPEAFRVLKQGSHCYVMINGRNLAGLQNDANWCGFYFQNLLAWDKGNKTPNRYYMQQLEFVLLLRKGPARSINNMGTSNLFSIKNPVGNKVHPTEKPVELMEIFVSNSSNEGDLVLDMFMGSGSTGVACVNTGRRFIGMEINEEYFNIASSRIDAARALSITQLEMTI